MTIQPLLLPRPPKSRAVTVIAWLAILSGAYVTFVAVTAMFLGHPTLRLAATLAGSLLTMIAGAGLNQREEWARQGFVLVQALSLLNLLVDVAATRASFGSILGLIFGLAINGWIIVKLRSPAVRAEFEESE